VPQLNNSNNEVHGVKISRGTAGQPRFSATWKTVNPFDKSAFIEFANTGIFNKWFDK